MVDAGASLHVVPQSGGDLGEISSVGAPTTDGPLAPDRDLAQRRLKAELILDGLMMAGLDALALGGPDWALGSDWVLEQVRESRAPLLAANLWCGGEQPFPPGKVVEVGGRRFGIVGVTTGRVDGCEITPLAPALREAVARLGPVDATVALVPARDDRELAMALDEPMGIDVVIDARGRHAQGAPERRHDAWVYGAGTRGKQLGVLSWTWTPGADAWAPEGMLGLIEDKIARSEQRLAAQRARLEQPLDDAARARVQTQVEAYETQLVTQRAELAAAATGATHVLSNTEIQLAKSLPEDPATRARIDRTLEAIRSMETGSMLQPLRVPHRVPDNAAWAGSDVCATCHPSEHAQWAQTAHAHAWTILVAEKREMDTECFGCHATAVGLPHGPDAPAAVGPFRDVQCEACHGPSLAHARTPTEGPPDPSPGVSVCVRCHDGSRDEGRFDHATYRPRILHGATDGGP